MEKEIINFYNGSNARPMEVRVLLFNDTLNIYESGTDNFISGFPIKGAATNQVAEKFFVYTQNQQAYLELDSGNPLVKEILKQVNDANKNIAGRLLRHRAFSLLLITLVLVLGLYFGLISLVPYLGSKLINTDTEIKIGRNLRELMIREELAAGSQVDSAGSRLLQQFVGKLKLSDKYPLHITLVKSKAVNAYALPGGEIVVYSGIIEKMSSYETLVALLAHESSHVNERHTLRSLLRSTANSIVISIVFGDATGLSGALAGNMENLNGLRYSRSLETEADNEGMKLMLANQVDVNGMKLLMDLLKKEGDMPESLAFLSTHPLTTERIQNTSAFIKSHNNSANNRKDLELIFLGLKHSK